DELRFCLYKLDGYEKAWHQVSNKYHKDCINITVKFGGGSVIFWWMKSHGFDILDWAPYSPDLNPIENLWECLDLALHNRRPSPKTQEELVKCIKEEWNKIPIEYIRSLICSMSARVMAIYKAKG
ncbi:560_t:CDS:2, partial [Dentiscutata heterogama]